MIFRLWWCSKPEALVDPFTFSSKPTASVDSSLKIASANKKVIFGTLIQYKITFCDIFQFISSKVQSRYAKTVSLTALPVSENQHIWPSQCAFLSMKTAQDVSVINAPLQKVLVHRGAQLCLQNIHTKKKKWQYYHIAIRTSRMCLGLVLKCKGPKCLT